MKPERQTMFLAGTWRFAPDRENAGIRERWFARTLDDTISLPGTTDEARKGEYVNEHCADRLSRVWRWSGPAWYQKRVTIPPQWKDRRIVLFLERTKDSQVWVDSIWVGGDDSLSTPHVFDLSAQLTPGRHTITILVDNAKLPPVGPCHCRDQCHGRWREEAGGHRARDLLPSRTPEQARDHGTRQQELPAAERGV